MKRTMARTIRVDDEVYAWLQRQARPFEDTPNSVLRGIAGLDTAEPQQKAMLKPRTEATAVHKTAHFAPQGEAVMSTPKFDELDRERTIRTIEERLGIKLEKVGSFRKFRVDQSGRPYLIFGGYGDWHGFTEKMIAVAQNQSLDGKLVIAKRTRRRIKIFYGPLEPLFQSVDKLTRTKENDRQFNLAWREGRPSIKEIPEIHLKLLEEIEYFDEKKEKDRRFKGLTKSITALSDEDRAAVLSTLGQASSS